MRFALALFLCLAACDEDETESDMSVHDLAGVDGAACLPCNTTFCYACDSQCKGASDGTECTKVGTNCEFTSTTFVLCESDHKWHQVVTMVISTDMATHD